MVGVIGVTDKSTSTAGVTVRDVFPDIVPEVALIMVDPTALLCAIPVVPTVTAGVFDDDHVTLFVMT